MRDKRGWTDHIIECGVIDNEFMTAAQVAEVIGTSQTTARGALNCLYSRWLVTREPAAAGALKYRKAQIHWIHGTPISANPTKCYGPRNWSASK